MFPISAAPPGLSRGPRSRGRGCLCLEWNNLVTTLFRYWYTSIYIYILLYGYFECMHCDSVHVYCECMHWMYAFWMYALWVCTCILWMYALNVCILNVCIVSLYMYIVNVCIECMHFECMHCESIRGMTTKCQKLVFFKVMGSKSWILPNILCFAPSGCPWYMYIYIYMFVFVFYMCI